jgi:competence protein ComEA
LERVQEIPRPIAPPTWRERLAALQQGRTVGPSVVVAGAVVVAVAVVAIGATLFLTGGAATSRGADVALSLPRADRGEGSTSSGRASPTTTSGELHVHAAGAVAQPGVVTVPGGSRVTDGVAAAGGPAPDADLDQINLAAPVSDGERVYVPRRGETVLAATGSGSGGGAAASDGIVNINSADAATLESLPGVGPATAQAIIDYRTQHGRFRSVDDLLNVRGIGPSKLSQIKPHARV